MASKPVVDAVFARLAELWAGCPVQQPNVGWQTPADASPFLSVQFPFAQTERVAVNQRTYREEGAFRLLIFTPTGAGIDEAMAWAEQLAGIFRDQAFGGIRTQAPGSPILNDDTDDGNYHRLSFAVPYTRVFHA